MLRDTGKSGNAAAAIDVDVGCHYSLRCLCPQDGHSCQTHLAIITNSRFGRTHFNHMYHCRTPFKENCRNFHLKKPVIIRIPNRVIGISSLKQQGIRISRKEKANTRNVCNQLFLLIEPLQEGPNFQA